MHVRKRFLPVTAIAALFLAAFAGSASASAPAPSPQDYVKQAITKQLAHKPGGKVTNGDTITYPNGVEIDYRPLASGTTISAAAVNWGCYSGYVCFYANGDHTAMRLNTSSLWCPWENTSRGDLMLGDYGLDGNMRSADSENQYWTEARWVTWYGNGLQWTMSPGGQVSNQSAQNVHYVQICLKEADLS